MHHGLPGCQSWWRIGDVGTSGEENIDEFGSLVTDRGPQEVIQVRLGYRRSLPKYRLKPGKVILKN